MGLDDLISEVIRHREERRNEARPLHSFAFERTARSLVAPARSRAKHHRQREKVYAKKLETAERELRKKGVSVEAVDNSGNIVNFSHVSSGSISRNMTTGETSMLQAKIDPKLLDAVKQAKTKVVEHQDKALKYEKYARCFACCPAGMKVLLSMEDAYFFQLGE